MTTGLPSAPETSPHPERIELILSQLTSLPALPAVAVRLLDLTVAPHASAADIVRLIECDAALTAAVLRMVRRADLGVRGEMITVERAVVLLGFQAVRNAVLSLELFRLFDAVGGDFDSGFDRREFWRHSLAVACAGQLLAERCKETDLAATVFVCGLLHDVGKIALEACLPKSYARVIRRVQNEHACISDAEGELFGFDHTVAGKRLVGHWNLPSAVIESVWMHHQSPDALPPSVAHPRVLRLVHLANDLIRREAIGFSGYTHLDDVEEQAEAFGLSGEQLDGVLADLPARIEPYASLVGVEQAPSEAVSPRTLLEANRALGRANAELGARIRLLETRSRCLDALLAFAGRLRPHDRLAEVCAAAAESICAFAGCERAVGFVIQPDGRCVHFGWVDRSEPKQSSAVVDIGRGLEQSELHGVEPQAAPSAITMAPVACEALWRRCFEAGVPDELWMLPVAGREREACGVLFAADRDAAADVRRARAECESLGASIGLAIANAGERAERERMNEELLDLNRRLRETRDELVRTRSLSLVAAMAAGAAHEINNPLAVISGRAQLLRDMAVQEEAAEKLQVIHQAAMSASEIVLELMSFAKPEPPEPVLQKVDDVLKALYQHWRERSSLGQGEFLVHSADRESTVFADPRHLKRILDELIANAVQFMKPSSARLHINSPSPATDDRVRIVVEDNGAGMTREVLEKAFTPFFSHRPAGRGRGMGLAWAYRFTELNGGRIRLESTPGKGTRAIIELPSRAPETRPPRT